MRKWTADETSDTRITPQRERQGEVARRPAPEPEPRRFQKVTRQRRRGTTPRLVRGLTQVRGYRRVEPGVSRGARKGLSDWSARARYGAASEARFCLIRTSPNSLAAVAR